MPDADGRFRLSISVPELPWLKQEVLTPQAQKPEGDHKGEGNSEPYTASESFEMDEES